MLAGDAPKADDIERVANRLFALGMTLNDVPETQNTFVGWDPKKTKDPEMFKLAAELFESSLKIKVSTKSRAALGSIYGFLGNWEKASATFAELFESQPILTGNPKKVNVGAANNNPFLLVALFEQGVAEYQIAATQNQKERFPQAQTIFDALIKVYQLDGWNWWHAQYYSIKNRADWGQYVQAKADLNDLERKSNDLGVKHGLGPAFEALKADLANK
jgi:tetratricopeptide (TPR) repeat protein